MSDKMKSAAEALLAQRKKQKEEENKGKKKFDSDILWVSLPKESDTEVILRFLPPAHGEILPGRIIRTHWNIPAGEKEPNKINSLLEFMGEKDPIEQVLAKFRDKINTEDYEASAKTYFNVLIKSIKVGGKQITMDDKKVPYNPKVPRVLGMSGDFPHTWLLEKLVDPEYGDVTDAMEGVWFRFKRKEAGGKWERDIIPYKKPDYDAGPFGRAVGESQEEVDSILSSLYDFNKIWKPVDDDYVKKARSAAARLEKLLEEKLQRAEAKELELSKNARSNDDSENEPLDRKRAAPEKVAPKAEPQAQAATSAEPEEKPKRRAPQGAPECFGDKSKLYAGRPSEDDMDADYGSMSDADKEQADKCRRCPLEFECQKSK